MNTALQEQVTQSAVATAVRRLAVAPALAAAAPPPKVAAPTNAKAVLVTLRLSAKSADDFRTHLLEVIPVTRIASGCRYSHTYQDPASPSEFTLVQGLGFGGAATGLHQVALVHG